jgi:hypothetical protein
MSRHGVIGVWWLTTRLTGLAPNIVLEAVFHRAGGAASSMTKISQPTVKSKKFPGMLAEEREGNQEDRYTDVIFRNWLG